jgi:2-polyprenyl-3-methyl-5-hydroxy-6-metoxy-1,4-benzoquinol methylase
MSNSYYNYILPKIKDKRVLDIGCISHSFEERSKDKYWNFDIFLEHAKYLKGIDILRNEVSEAQKEGYNIEFGNAEIYISTEKYDVVFAGDLIEHLGNPAQFLNCSHKNLHNHGLLMLVTPNTFSISNIFKAITKFTNEPPVNPEHTCYFTPKTVSELVSREKFEVADIYYTNTNYSEKRLDDIRKGSFPLFIQMKMNYLLTKIFPQFSQAFIIVLRKKCENE